MVIILQILVVLLCIVLIIVIAHSVRKDRVMNPMPENIRGLLNDYVRFYNQLNEKEKELFEKRIEQFLKTVKITGVNAEIEDLDLVLIAAGAIIPVFRIPDWQYINLHEVLVYPGLFNGDFDQHGPERNVAGMVGTGAMQNVMILDKWLLRQGFINPHDASNTAIHEFAHLVDKMDGTVDGVPEIILERKYVPQWRKLMEDTIAHMKQYGSDINMYGTTNTAEFFAVISEYFFEQPAILKNNHPELYQMLVRIYRTGN